VNGGAAFVRLTTLSACGQVRAYMLASAEKCSAASTPTDGRVGSTTAKTSSRLTRDGPPCRTLSNRAGHSAERPGRSRRG
jgi:hypothetical protein